MNLDCFPTIHWHYFCDDNISVWEKEGGEIKAKKHKWFNVRKPAKGKEEPLENIL